MTTENKSHRPIRSFVKREGRMTTAQKQAIEQLWPRYGLDLRVGRLDLDTVFGRSAARILEIGFGNGEALLTLAKRHPEFDYIGVEVHRPGVGALLLQADKEGIQNLKVFIADVNEVLYRCIPDDSLDAIHLFFPDPWPKKRHHKRRLINADFVELLRAKLKLGGNIHLATDWHHYAEHMMAVMTRRSKFC